ncbi:type III pantothenate kinase [Compostibacter hankyongensis]|uniref:Type III pantothenate kinase n=1 Tax=Compostibacter hankyongensis TaxID=1007089 RepID=A0ABP8FDP5_9BACT
MTYLCLDFGNSRQKAAWFSNGVLEGESLLEPASLTVRVKELVGRHSPDGIILSSVIDHPEEIDTFLAAQPFFIRLDADTPLPFHNAYETPRSLGPDRLALAAAAQRYYPGQHNLVIALGSCITFNFLTGDGVFLGGSIAPGLQMRFRAMHAFTGRLPLLGPEEGYPLVGSDTRQSMLSGVLNGMRAELDGLIEQYREVYSNFNVLLTGGDMAYFAGRLKNKIFADLTLSYKGLHAILEFNAGRNG